MLKHPKWLKPLSILIEVVSAIIVLVVIWAILTAIKSLLALWALGTCNVTKPAACTLGAEVCSIDEAEPANPIEATGRWFTEWGEIFEAIPDKFHNYNAEDYEFNYITVNDDSEGKPISVDIFDPGCSVCMMSYRNQKESGFFDNYDVRMVPFAIQDPSGTYKFKNSEIIVRYMFASEQLRSGLAMILLDHIFTDKNSDGIYYQSVFNNDYTSEEAVARLEKWIVDTGFNKDGLGELRDIAYSDETTTKMTENQQIITNDLRVKGIPTMVYGGQKHTGLFKL